MGGCSRSTVSDSQCIIIPIGDMNIRNIVEIKPKQKCQMLHVGMRVRDMFQFHQTLG